ncbi:uncharacterized protein L203_102131 [Cryptococcus depauperatus CBS 7841]|uniref:Uncharacterized protein n=1 Tax=Cryptococcus depauperatus CBS 7841 TaxID=1295531 RepID=A0A1E3IRE8_9TREE|nr:hypothetical protein L203_01383 [Cryptococcus depauperatus CBS 7841]
MVYTHPQIPFPANSNTSSPAKEPASWHRAQKDNMASSPMPILPRRFSSNSTTSRRGASPSFTISRPLEGLPRRASHSSGAASISGLPPAGEGSSLGLKLHGSPSQPSSQKELKDELPSHSPLNGDSSVPVPDFDPKFRPAKRPSPNRSPFSSNRPTLLSHRLSSGHAKPCLGLQSHQTHFPSSASTSELTSTPTPISPDISRPSTIRKKSGEIVKPSLKQRSLSTPDLTRQNHVSSSDEEASSNTFGSERSKSVRFADANEGDANALESVVLFLREQKVTAVSKAIDPESQPTDTETENETDASDFVQFRTRRNAAARATDEANQIQLDSASRVPRKRTDFSPDARGSLSDENVILERTELQTGTCLALRGTVIVRNLAFRKWVAVRFTLDHWQTVSEVSGTHVCHIPPGTTGDEGWDRFSFAIKLEDYKRKLEDRQLILCVHYSIDGKDWWDSNDGINYNFTFKKVPSRRLNRTSVPASISGYPLSNDSISTLPRLRSNNIPPPSSQIRKTFGARDNNAGTLSSNWVFPKLSQRVGDNITRPDSPLQSPPPKTAYKPPEPPTIHTHLSLSKYCAPSPPQSPVKQQDVSLTSNDDLANASQQVSDKVTSSQYTTLTPIPSTHERRSSWNGQANKWKSFTDTMNKSKENTALDGEKTPVATDSRSLESESTVMSPETCPHKPLTLKRSTGDLRKLVQEAEDNDNGLITPPSSNLSSPPTSVHSDLPPDLLSPSPASTGESSPVNSMSLDSTPDLSTLTIEIDPQGDERERVAHPKDHKFFNPGSYQEFLDKFCFFQSQSPHMMTSNAPHEIGSMHNRPSFIPISRQNSPTGFPFFQHNSSHSPLNSPTPTKHYTTAQEAFGFSSSSQSTPTKYDKLSPAMLQPQPTQNSPINQFVSGYHANPADTLEWAQQIHSNTASPSLAAAK